MSSSSIFASAPVGIVLADLETDEIVEANDAYCRIVGRSHADVMRDGWLGMTHPDDVAEGAARLNQLRAGNTHAYNLSKRYLKPDGYLFLGGAEATVSWEMLQPEQANGATFYRVKR